jgi:hypothetical protein
MTKDTRLLRLLQTCTKEEWALLRKFVRSPYFNNRSEVVDLLEILLQYLKKGQEIPEKIELFEKIYENMPFDDHRLRLAMSFLYKNTSQFLVVQRLINDEVLMQKELSQIFRQRQLNERSEKVLANAFEQQQLHPLRNADFLEEKYQLLLARYRSEVDSNQAEKSDLQALSEQLDDAFLARKLWQACFMWSHSAVHNTKFDFGVLQTMLDFLKNQPLKLEIPAIGLYFHCFLALSEPTQTIHFQRFKTILTESAQFFPDQELRDIFILALNFCSRQYNAGNTDYLPEQLRLYQEGLKKGYFLTDGTLMPYTYQNAATIGLILKEFDWVEKFVHEYQSALLPENRKGLFHFNLARLAYNRKQLGVALSLLQKAEYKDIMLNLAAKTLQLKIYYELDEFDLLASHLQAFRAFLNRRKDIGYHRENYLNLVIFSQKLLEINIFNKKERENLKIQIKEVKVIAERDWLLNCLNN